MSYLTDRQCIAHKLCQFIMCCCWCVLLCRQTRTQQDYQPSWRTQNQLHRSWLNEFSSYQHSLRCPISTFIWREYTCDCITWFNLLAVFHFFMVTRLCHFSLLSSALTDTSTFSYSLAARWSPFLVVPQRVPKQNLWRCLR